MLDYVVTLCLDKGQAEALEFPKEFTMLDKATRLPSREVSKSLGEMKRQVIQRLLGLQSAGLGARPYIFCSLTHTTYTTHLLTPSAIHSTLD